MISSDCVGFFVRNTEVVLVLVTLKLVLDVVGCLDVVEGLVFDFVEVIVVVCFVVVVVLFGFVGFGVFTMEVVLDVTGFGVDATCVTDFLVFVEVVLVLETVLGGVVEEGFPLPPH